MTTPQNAPIAALPSSQKPSVLDPTPVCTGQFGPHDLLQRHNAQLPTCYRSALPGEARLMIRALLKIADAILSSREASRTVRSSTDLEQHPCAYTDHLETKPMVAEGYQTMFERDISALEKGIGRYLDLKHSFEQSQFQFFTNIMIRAALSPSVDMGLRSKTARCASRILAKRFCCMPQGIPFRAIMKRIVEVHIDSIEGSPYVGRDVRESHCRNLVSLLTRSRNFLTPDDSAQKIWNELATKLTNDDVDEQFKQLLLLSHVLPTRGETWSGWVADGMSIWQSISSSSDWDTVWMGLFSRLARHQPCLHDWTPYMSWVYSRMMSAFPLPLGPYASHGQIDRRCPSHLYFLMDGKTINMFAMFAVYSLSPKFPEALTCLERFFTLIANYFHPSNSGSWSSSIGMFLSHVASSLSSRVNEERSATKAGVHERVVSGRSQKGVAPLEHRLTPEIIEKMISILHPLIHHGLHSKVATLSIQSASAAKELALVEPVRIVEPMLIEALDGLCSISSPHRTTAALKLLSLLSPVFLDREICPTGCDYLTQALELTLPGIDPNDLGKTEYTMRFIAAASARLQSIVCEDQDHSFDEFLDNYVRQMLDRVFSLLESLEAPPKKNRNGTYVSHDAQLSFFIFSGAIENLFAALPEKSTKSVAQLIAQKVIGSACMNSIKYYGTLVRIAASAAAVSGGGSAVSIFVPPLVHSILEDDDSSGDSQSKCLANVAETELVWRIRMLAQACRSVGSGIDEHLDDIISIIKLAMDKPERPVYKAGGRLLRGVLEGLTCIEMEFGSGTKGEAKSDNHGTNYDFHWHVPSKDDWKHGERLIEIFVKRAEELCNYDPDLKNGESLIVDRDVLFRVLRLLHAIQRGGRWLFGGAMPEHFRSLDKYLTGKAEMSKSDAILALKRPVRVGLGGERHGSDSEEFATKMWNRTYTLISAIIDKVMKVRPDDGALLYRCLEPIELAHEPFRKGDRSRQTMYASRIYKSSYRSVTAAKRPFGAKGGVGRAMPRFIIKLRVEAHHEMRLSIGARGGAGALDMVEKIVGQLSKLALNDFPRVRSEARGVLTRALRVVRPHVRKMQVIEVIESLRFAVSGTNSDKQLLLDNISTEDGDKVMVDRTDAEGEDGHEQNEFAGKSTSSSKAVDILYEKITGASSILRSSALAPVIMRGCSLFTLIMKTILFVMPQAERADGASSLVLLFAKLAALVRPLRLSPLRLVGEDLRSFPDREKNDVEQNDISSRLQCYEDLNQHLLGLVHGEFQKEGVVSPVLNSEGEAQKSDSNNAHWKSQLLVTTVLYFLLREDVNPSPAVAEFFIRGMTSDIVALRQLSSRAVFLMLILSARKAKSAKLNGEITVGSEKEWAAAGNKTLSKVASFLCSKEHVRKLIHTLSLDHDDGSDSNGRRRFNFMAAGGIGYTFMTRTNDGDLSWMAYGGRPWPSSWHPRSKDLLNIVRLRYYETFARVFGKSFYDAAIPTLSELVENIKKKREKIIEGVKDGDVKVLAGEVLAALCRGLSISQCKDDSIQNTLLKLAIDLLREISGPTGNINGGTIIRLITTSEPGTIGVMVRDGIQNWLFESRPLIVGMEDGPVAHLQARRLRYLHACVCDTVSSGDPGRVRFGKELIPFLMGTVGFDHELKTVREEVSRCLALVAIDVPRECETDFHRDLTGLLGRLKAIDATEVEVEENAEIEDDDSKSNGEADEGKKSRSRQRETLCQFVSISQWNGRAQGFETYVPKVIHSLFSCYNERNPERVSHARMSLSFIAQGTFSLDVVDAIVARVEETAKDSRWKVRSGIPGFLQVFSFMTLFTARPETLTRIRNIIMDLLSDSSLEVRQGAANTFVTVIRDAKTEMVNEARRAYMQILEETRPKRLKRGAKRKPTDPDTLRKRHGAVLGLSSMVISSPYTVPKWMPPILVSLSSCVNDPSPISTDGRKLFADFMRTHRDEWQIHKQAFTSDELEIISELTVSPSYYA